MLFSRLPILAFVYLFVFSLFLILTGPALFAEGMFLDGTMYAAIAKNLAINKGSFWNLYYADCLYPQFNEHPPLAFGIQAFFFQVFGDSLYVERFYSLSCFIISGYFLREIWVLLKLPKTFSWLPLFYFVLMPLVPWCASNNLLENTMLIFVLCAVYLFIKAKEKGSIVLIFFSGMMLALAFLTKGFTGLFPFVLPLTYSFYFLKESLVKASLEVVLMVLGFVSFLLLLFIFNEDALDAFQRYFNKQVLGSLENVKTVNTRFYILFKGLTECLIPLSIFLLLAVYFRFKKLLHSFTYKRLAFSFLGLGVAGILPITISMKQSGFYLLTALPFLAFSIAVFSFNLIQELFHRISIKSYYFKLFSLTVLLFSMIICAISFGKQKRNKEMLNAVHVFPSFYDTKNSGTSIQIGITPSLNQEWGLHAYFMRYLSWSLCPFEQQNYVISRVNETLNDYVKLNENQEFIFWTKRK